MRFAGFTALAALALLLLPASALATSVEVEAELAPDVVLEPAQPALDLAVQALQESGVLVCAPEVCWLLLRAPPVALPDPDGLTGLGAMWCESTMCGPGVVVYLVQGASDDALGSVAQVVADFQGKGQLLTSAATAIQSNLAGQANAAVSLAASVVANVLASTNQVVALELPVCHIACTIIDDAIFAKESAEALALGMVDGGDPFVVVVMIQGNAAEGVSMANAVLSCDCFPPLLEVTVLVQVIVSNVIFTKQSAEAIAIGAASAATEDPAAAATSGSTALAALLITVALEKQAAATAFANAVIEA